MKTSHLRLRVDPRVICLMRFARSTMLYEKEQTIAVSTLLSSVLGLLGSQLVAKINQEINTKNLTEVEHCKVGLEVHFKEAEGRHRSQIAPSSPASKHMRLVPFLLVDEALQLKKHNGEPLKLSSVNNLT